MMTIDIAKTPVFNANKRAYDKGKFRVISNQGSTRSSKTYSLSQLMIDIASGGRNKITGEKYEKKEISIVSPSLPHLKKGARKDVLKILEDLNLFVEDDFNRTDQIYHFPVTGSYIEFFGAEDSKKVRGPGRQILYVNEANLLNYETYLQLALRTSETIFIDFNPADEYNWVYDVSDKEGNKLIISTYANNKANLTKEQVEEIENLKNVDDNLWKVFGLGMRGTSSETIYTHWRITEHGMPNKGEQFFGLDFGFNNQTALVLCEIYEGLLYVDQWIYQSKLTTSDLIDEMRILGVRRSLEIYADCAEPKTIEEIARAGYNIYPSDKDVKEGIRTVRSMPMRITKNSVDVIKEAKSYKWKKDKDGKVLDEPVKFNDHSMDAIRYALFTKLTTNTYSWVAK